MLRATALLLTILAFCALLSPAPAGAQQLIINGPAPDFDVTAFGGKEFTLADFKGQVLVINFWATWCVPCKKELPLLEGYYRAQGKFGLRVLAVTTEDSLPLRQLAPLASSLTLLMARHFHGPYRALKAVPTNYVIDRAGILRYAKADAFTLDDLNAVLVPLLQEPPPDEPR